MIIVSVFFPFLHSFWSALQKYNISQTKKRFVKPPRGLVYHYVNGLNHKKLDFNLLQNRNPTVVYVVVYAVAVVETQNFSVLQLVFQPKSKKSVINSIGVFLHCDQVLVHQLTYG